MFAQSKGTLYVCPSLQIRLQLAVKQRLFVLVVHPHANTACANAQADLVLNTQPKIFTTSTPYDHNLTNKVNWLIL